MQYNNLKDNTIYVDVPIANSINNNIIEIHPLPCNNAHSLNEIVLTTNITIDNIELHETIRQSICPSKHDDMSVNINVCKIIIALIIIIIIGILVFYVKN